MQVAYPVVNVTGIAADATVIDNLWHSYTPQITIVGGGTAPNYTTNLGRFVVANNVVRCDIFLTGDGGTPGAGGGSLWVSLPVLPSVNTIGTSGWVGLGGYFSNGGANPNQILMGSFTVGSPLLSLGGYTGANAITVLTGAEQNNTARTVQAHFWYETSSTLL